MPKCPECGRMFEPTQSNQAYCKYNKTAEERSRCSHRARGRRNYRNIDPDVYERKRQRTKEWRTRMGTEGKCIRCGVAPAEPGGVSCSMCEGRDR